MSKDKQKTSLAPLTKSQAVTGRAERCLFIKDHGDAKRATGVLSSSRLWRFYLAQEKNDFEGHLTVAVIGTCVWAGVDSLWEQEKLEARKMLENAAESHTSGARFVGCDFIG